ncbi:hypothetical protein GCM10010308_16890 [Streptomyces vinaceusdrappus]|nr:hypothetical protein GCM10010301_41700 [Streptomyces plicatus]GHC04810.1 hypothetical protein GCM10010308_16890 [Streptomyces vinaceusdrappus]
MTHTAPRPAGRTMAERGRPRTDAFRAARPHGEDPAVRCPRPASAADRPEAADAATRSHGTTCAAPAEAQRNAPYPS